MGTDGELHQRAFSRDLQPRHLPGLPQHGGGARPRAVAEGSVNGPEALVSRPAGRCPLETILVADDAPDVLELARAIREALDYRSPFKRPAAAHPVLDPGPRLMHPEAAAGVGPRQD